MYDEEGVDRTPKQLVQRQMVSVRPPQQHPLPATLPAGPRTTASVSVLGRHNRESRMGSRMSKLSASHPLLTTEAPCSHMPASCFSYCAATLASWAVPFHDAADLG